MSHYHDFMPDLVHRNENWIAAAALQPLETNFAPVELVSGTAVNLHVRAFDDTTEEYANGSFKAPSSLNTVGNVRIKAIVMAKTAAASKNVGITFGHLAVADGEDFDPASPYTDLDSGGIAINSTQDNITEITMTDTVANLGWEANDNIIFRISRDTGVSSNLVGDMYLLSIVIDVPKGD